MSRVTRKKSILSEPGPPLSPLPATAQPTPTSLLWVFPALLVVYLVLACTHMMLAPTGETGYQNAPDEAAHMAYVRSLALGHFPTMQQPLPARLTAPSYEWHQPPLYYLFAMIFLPLGEKMVRLASVLCGTIALWMIYRTLRLAYPERPLLAITAAGVAALIPTHVAITSTVNNDVLLELFFSGTLLALLASFHGGFTTRRAIWLGLGISGAILTKATGLLLLPISLFGLLLFWRAGESSKTLLRGAGIAIGTILALTGWWFVRNLMLYGEPLPLHGFAVAFAGTKQASEVASRIGGWGAYLIQMAQGIFMSFWAVYGRPEDLKYGVPRFLPDSIYLLMGFVCIMALIGMIRIHFRRHLEFSQTQIYSIWLLFASVGLVAASFFMFILKYFQMQGRYLYPAMLPISFILALGWLSVFPPRYQALASALLLTLLGSCCILLLRSL